MSKVLTPVAQAVEIVLSETMVGLINNAIQADANVYGARIDFAVGVNNISPVDCAWYNLEANGQKLPPVILKIKEVYYDGLKKINYSNPSNAWKMIKQYAQKDAVNRCMFGEVAPIEVEGEAKTESESNGAGTTHRKPQERLLAELTAVHEYCMREIGKTNPDFNEKHRTVHIKVIEALKILGKTIGI